MLKINQLPSPNFGSRKEAIISMLVLHYTGMKSGKAALERLCDSQAQVSAHYVVEEDGMIHQLVDEANCAWHAGVSHWRGHKNVNNISIGIEIVNPGHEYGYRAFPEAQMQAVAELSKSILSRHNISPSNVVAHSDVAPQRKEDPGELFDWKWLAGHGVGTWPTFSAVKKQYDEEEDEADPMEMLAEYGYEIPQEIERIPKVITAFQRHFRPKRIDGAWDDECDELLAALLKMR